MRSVPTRAPCFLYRPRLLPSFRPRRWTQTAPADQAAVTPRQPGGDGNRRHRAPPYGITLRDVPIAVTAYSGEQLRAAGRSRHYRISDTTPNVTLETSRGTNTTLTAFIRGVGQQDPVAGFEQGVGIYLDDVYLNRPQGAVLDIYDVERIEVLRGPQGTLYGRNTIGGAVKYVSAPPPTAPSQPKARHLGNYGQPT